MADNLRKFTTQEVLNKVYTDSSGITIGLNSQSSKETLNAVLDSSNNRLQVAMAGGTISGDVTISGDLTVIGSGGMAFSEVLAGDMKITTSGSATALYIESSDSGASLIQFTNSTTGTTTNDGLKIGLGDDEVALFRMQEAKDMVFQTASTTRFVLDDNTRISLANNTSFDGGTSNTVFGRLIASANNIQAGSNYNVFIGEEVASDGSLSLATNNVIIGYQAGEDLTTADSSVFIGYQAGKEHSGGGSNVAIGSAAFANSNAGNVYSNTFIGTSSGGGNWTSASVSNVGVGQGALGGNLDGITGAVAVGTSALAALTSGTKNTAIGYQAGTSITTSSHITYIGYRAGYYATGANNTALGNEAYFGVDGSTTGADNSIFGYYAGRDLTTGHSNVLMGRDAGQNLTSGYQNIIIGTDAGETATGLQNAILIGQRAGQAINSGVHGTIGIGYQALTALTSGTANTAIGYQAAAELSDNSHNTVVGYQAMYRSGATVYYNTFIGSQSGSGDWSGGAYSNVAVGASTMTGVMTGTAIGNVAVGRNALAAVTSGFGNVAIGLNAADSMTDNKFNVAIGQDSLATADSGENYNIAIGNEAMNTVNNSATDHNIGIGYQAFKGGTGNNNIAIGQTSMNQTGTAADGIVAIGKFTVMGATTSGADNTIAIGTNALNALTSGSRNLAIGYESGKTLLTGNDNISIGYQAFSDLDATSTPASSASNVFIGNYSGGNAWGGGATSNNNTAVGMNTMRGPMDGSNYNTAIGSNALYVVRGSNNVGIGYKAGYEVQTGSNNTLIGALAGDFITTDQNVVAIGASAYSAQDTANDSEGSSGHGSGNIAIGYQSMQSFNQVNFLRNTAIGFQTMSVGSSHDPQDSVAVGYRALQSINDGDANTAIGSKALKSVTTGDSNVAVGSGAGSAMLGSTDSIAIGKDSLNAMAGDTTTDTDNMGFRNIGIGTDALGSLNGTHVDAFSNDNIAIGFQAGLAGSRGSAIPFSGNIAIGSYALDATGSYKHTGTIAIGHQALTALTTGERNTAVGYQSALNNATGTDGTFLGYQSGLNVLLNYNTGIGAYTLQKLGTTGGGGAGENNTALGALAMSGGDDTAANNTAKNNVAVGYASLGGATKASDGAAFTTDDSVAIGYNALTAITTGDNNVAIGSNALPKNTTASNNVAIGKNSMLDITTGQRNVAVGSFSMAMNQGGTNAKTSVDNVFIGYNSGGGSWANAVSNQNTAVGANTMDAACDGATDNTAFGFQSLTALTTGDNNVAIGTNAGASVTAASRNVYVGFEAGDVSNSSENVSIGYQSMGADAYNTVCLGFMAGTQAAGGRNVYIGSNTAASATTGTWNTLLGPSADLDTGTDSYQTQIGAYGIVKYITAVFEFTAGHATLHGAISMVSRIPARAVVTEAAVIVQDLSSNATHNLELILSTDATKTVDSALTTSGITAPVLVGNSAAITYAQDSVTAIGTSNHIDAGTSSGVSGTVYYNKPTTTIGHASSDMYAWIANGDGSSNSDSSSSIKVRVKIGYISL